MEDVEGGRKLSESILVFFWITCLCQEIGLVTILFFFKFLFFNVSLQFLSMLSLLTYFQSLISLSADYLRHS